MEKVVGIDDDLLIQTHGNVESCSCIACNKVYSTEYVEACLEKSSIPHCECGGLIKPSIVFFGEKLPLKFTRFKKRDLSSCDLLLVLGTSLSVEPLASLVEGVRSSTPRVLINREAVGPFRFCGMSSCYRDVCFIGDCDTGVRSLCSYLGWERDVDSILESVNGDDFPKEFSVSSDPFSILKTGYSRSAPLLLSPRRASEDASHI